MQPAAICVDRIKVHAKDRSGLIFFVEFFRDVKGTKGHANDDMIST